MDDAKYGTEDSRGYWQPKGRISYGPVFEWPPKPKVLLKWFFGFPGYLFPWNVIYAVAAVGIWVYLTPALETMRTFSFSWAGQPHAPCNLSDKKCVWIVVHSSGDDQDELIRTKELDYVLE